VVDEVDRLLHLVVACDVQVEELELRTPQVRDVLQRAGLEVVHAEHPVAVLDEVVAEVGA
jgi:hypothetical protein